MLLTIFSWVAFCHGDKQHIGDSLCVQLCAFAWLFPSNRS